MVCHEKIFKNWPKEVLFSDYDAVLDSTYWRNAKTYNLYYHRNTFDGRLDTFTKKFLYDIIITRSMPDSLASESLSIRQMNLESAYRLYSTILYTIGADIIFMKNVENPAKTDNSEFPKQMFIFV